MLRAHADDDFAFVKALTSLVGIGVLVIWVVIYQAMASKREHDRLQMISEKYTGETAARLAQKTLWHGQTAEQLRDSLGHPEAVEVKPMKTRHREIWKYNSDGVNRYRTRVTLDDGIVTTWARR